MTDIARLQLRIESIEADLAGRRIDRLGQNAARTERATDGLTGSFKRMIGPLAAAVSATAALTKLVEVQRQFDVLNAGLITATGSAEKASVAFEAISDFAAKTPYDLGQAVDGFTKLVNLGLTPSEKALVSYGNTASAMGKDLNQMIEAVADAATGEFERLKEFGIKASKEGDRVSLTFRGTTTEIGNSAAEIEQYLMALGENEFAGAMERRMDSLDGALSNLGDSWDALFRNISEAGVGESIEGGVRLAIDALDELNAMLASGEMQQYLLAIASSWGDLGADARQSMAITADFVSDIFRKTGGEGKTFAGVVFETMSVLGANTLFVLKGIGIELGGIAAQLAALARGDFSGFAEIGRQMKADAAQAREEIDNLTESILNPKEGGGSTSAFQQHMEEAKRLRDEWDKAREARQNATEDRLAQFKTGGSGKSSDGLSKTEQKAAEAAAKRQQKEFESLVASLRTEEEAIAESYARRRAIIEANTADGSGARSDLLGRLDQERADSLAKLEEQRNAEVQSLTRQLMTEEEQIQDSYTRRMAIIQENRDLDAASRAELEARVGEDREKALADVEAQRQSQRDQLYNGLLTEEEMLLQSYERKKQQILESEEVTEMERQDLLRRLKQQFDDETRASEMKRIQTQLGDASNLFGGLADLAKNYGGEQSKAYRALFAVSKAFSIAQAGISIATGLAKAQELGFPANLAEMARVAASGASIISQITGSNFSGAHDEGGRIPAGKIGIVGEYGPELVRGPAAVTGRELTSRMAREGGGSGSPALPPQVNVRVVNAPSREEFAEFLGSDEGEQLILNVGSKNPEFYRSFGGN